jgi:hypothetical protein
MNSYFIMPVTTASINGDTVNVPQHFSDILQPNGVTWTALPMGLDNATVVSVSDAATITQLQKQSDTYSFPTDLTTTLQDSDVTALVAFLQNLNVPADQITTGQTFAQVLTVIAQVFLAAQAIAGVTGSAIFTSGVTLSSAVSDSGASTLAPTQTATLGGASLRGAGSSLGAGAGAVAPTATPTSNGIFDFSGVSSSDTLSDTLTNLAAQFVGPVVIGGVPL